jgi:hypothetical protein
MNKPARKYPTKDIEMLTTASVIIENAIANKTFLQTKRANWTDAFLDNIKTQIQTTTDNHLGKDAAKNMRQASQIVYTIQATAKTNLSELKIQIEEDYKQNPTQKTEILTQLGYTSYYKQVQKNDQEALVNQLFQYKQNLTPALKADIIAKGTAEATLDAITAQAQILKDANITQETLKGSRKEITNEAIIAFNEIYDQIISIAKISQRLYKGDTIKKEQFSFAKVAANLNAQTTSKTSKKQ